MAESTTRRAPRKAAPSKAAVKRAAATRAVPPGKDEFVGRLAELAAEARLEPYPVTATLSIEPPDKARADMLAATQATYLVCRNQLEAMTTPLPDPAAEDGILRDTEGVPIMPEVSPEVLERLQKMVQDAAVEYDKALFGDAYQPIMDRFAREQGTVYNAFYRDVSEYFMPSGEGGKCPTCGTIVDASAEGNAAESSTSSTATGTE